MVTIYNDELNAVFNRRRGLVIEVLWEDMVCPKSVLSTGSIKTLGVHLNSLDFDRKLLDTMRVNTEAVHELTDVVFSQWDCDHIFSKISNYSALFLDMTSRQYLSVLTLFTLDVSCLSRGGLFSIQEVLRRSDLEHLHVVCTLVTSQSESIAKVLGSVQ
ncbi:MAG: hypothetical protein BYD32DRAFT_441834 [Podila humilis]|nr:MAG: hypothetical protein BYD32DRAFT_441834 [Podila humilis]